MSGVDEAHGPAPLLEDRGGGVAVGLPIGAVPVTHGHRGHWKENAVIEYFHVLNVRQLSEYSCNLRWTSTLYIPHYLGKIF